MFELFKLLEMFDGKIILGANELSPDEITYLAEYKSDLNDRILQETEARRKQIDQEMRNRNSNAKPASEKEEFDKYFGHIKNRRKIN